MKRFVFIGIVGICLVIGWNAINEFLMQEDDEKQRTRRVSGL